MCLVTHFYARRRSHASQKRVVSHYVCDVIHMNDCMCDMNHKNGCVCDMTDTYHVRLYAIIANGVATMSRLLEIIGLFCKKAL